MQKSAGTPATIKLLRGEIMNMREHIPQLTDQDMQFVAEQVEGMPADLGRLKGIALMSGLYLRKLYDIHRAAQVEAFGAELDHVSDEAFNALPAWQREQLQITSQLSLTAMKAFEEAEQEYWNAV